MKTKFPQRLSEILQVRVTPSFLEEIGRVSEGRSQTIPDYVRSVLSEALYGPTLVKSRGKSRREREK